MNGIPPQGLSYRGGWFSALASWLRTGSSAASVPAESAPRDTGGPVLGDNRPIHVLVVDDNPVNLMVMSAMLELRGLVPMLAADGAEAVALAREWHFDLILMDLQMPIVDGLEATSTIRRLERGSPRPPVPVVAYSSANAGDSVLAAAGLNGKLSKPCEDLELEDCLIRWCPTYCPAPDLLSAAQIQGAWQAAGRRQGSGAERSAGRTG